MYIIRAQALQSVCPNCIRQKRAGSLFFYLFDNIRGDVVRQVMCHNQAFLQFLGQGIDDFADNGYRKFGAVYQAALDVFAFRIFVDDILICVS